MHDAFVPLFPTVAISRQQVGFQWRTILYGLVMGLCEETSKGRSRYFKIATAGVIVSNQHELETSLISSHVSGITGPITVQIIVKFFR